jgi:hypothetical protein
MSDALCGPSNALQNFQKHTSVDRTLQQDRLTSRQAPGQVGGSLKALVFSSVLMTFSGFPIPESPRGYT